MNEFKEELAQAVKDAGRQIIDMADDIAGDTTLLQRLNIHVNFDPEYDMRVPTIEVHRKYICKESIDRLNRKDEKEQISMMEPRCETCRYSDAMGNEDACLNCGLDNGNWEPI